MKKASSSFLLLFFAALFVSFQSYAQISVEIGRPQNPRVPQRPNASGEVIHEQLNHPLRSYERLRLSDLLRLSWQEQRELRIRSLRVLAQSQMAGQSVLELSHMGRIIGTQPVRRQLSEALFMLPIGTTAEGLELSSTTELYLSAITAEVERRGHGGGYGQQVAPHSLVTLQVNQSTRGYSVIDLDQLLRQQQGLILEGAEIERVVVLGQPSLSGRAASVQVELNHRPVGDMKYLSPQQRQVPLPIQSFEETRSLGLIVNGDAQIFEVRIRVGQVRPRGGYEMPQVQRLSLNQELAPRLPLELSQVLRQESRLIRSITIEARSLRQAQAEIALLSRYGESQGVLFVGPNTARATIQLRRPMSAQELRLESAARVLVEALEIEFEGFSRI